MYLVLLIILIILLIFEWSKFISNICFMREDFTTNRTNIVFSDYKDRHPDEKYAVYDEEILVITQQPKVAIRKEKFKFLNGPLDKYYAIYARKSSEPNKIVGTSVILKINQVNIPIIQTFSDNNVLINDDVNYVNYYIRVLSDEGYRRENKINLEKIRIQNEINDCINVNRHTIGYNAAELICNSKK